MVSSKLKQLITENKVSQKAFCEFIEMTPQGFRNALELDDFRLSALRKFSEYFKVPLSFWISDENPNFFLNNEGNLVNGSSFKGNLTVNKNSCESELAKARVEIEQLRRENEMLKQLLEAKDETIQALKNK